MLRLELIRQQSVGDYTEGQLFDLKTGKKICDTLEDRVREVKVYGKTAIPAGLYWLCPHYSEKFHMWTIMLKNVPNFTYILLHGGRTVENTDGCILVGKKVKDGELSLNGMTLFLYRMFQHEGYSGEINIR